MIRILKLQENTNFLNIKYLEDLYEVFNKDYFNNELENYPIEIKTIKTNMAKVVSFGIKDDPSSIDVQKIVFSDFIDWTKNDIKGIMVHEMIHIYLIEKNMEYSHGLIFKEKLRVLNKITPFEVPLTEDITYKKVSKNTKQKNVLAVFVNKPYSYGVTVFNYKLKNSIIDKLNDFPSAWLKKFKPTIVESNDIELQKYKVKTKVNVRSHSVHPIDKEIAQRIIDQGKIIYQY